MGFRNLHEFNVAMLGKQGWRLVTNSNTLVARIFKAKYYPNDNFLSARLGASPSFVWRSIFTAQHILRQGLGGRVGNGKLVKIVNEPWLPNTENPYVMTESQAIQGQTVSALMVTNEREWDEDLIRGIFIQRDVNLILATPLSYNNEDSWYWRKERYGNYSVKSAYTLIQESKHMESQYGNSSFWKRLWNLTVPPKVKKFMWRAITGCLPTKDNLRIKRVNVNIECALCNREAESTCHILLDCSFARSCWERMGIHVYHMNYDTFLGWAVDVFNNWSADNRQSRAMLCWMIWKCRNDVIWNKKYMEVQEVANSARVVLSQWKEAQDKYFDRSWGLINPNDGAERWFPPTENQTKINTDAAIFGSSNCYSFAFAARDHQGELIEVRSSCKAGYAAPEYAEAMGIREALSWIKARQMSDTIVETDCLVAVQAIRSNAAMVSYFGVVIQEYRDLLKELEVKGVVLNFVNRSVNNLAHALASCSYSVADRIWEANVVYPEISHVLVNDLN